MKIPVAAFILLSAGLASAFGLPNLLIDAECQVFANQCTDVTVACTYVGLQGRLVVIPHWEPYQSTKCSRVTLLPLQWPLWQSGPSRKPIRLRIY